MKEKKSGFSLDQLSIKWKWSLIISVTIMVVYVIFALLVYYSTQQVILDKEQHEVEVALQNVEDSVSTLSTEFTQDSIQSLLVNRQLITDAFTPDWEEETTVAESDVALSQLSLRIVDAGGEEVFSVGPGDYPIQEPNDLIIRPISDSPDFSLLASKPIYSQITDDLIGYIQVHNNLESFHSVIDQLINSIMVIGILILALSIFLGLFVSERLLSPIRRLRNAMAGIIKEPDSDTRLTVKGSDEFAELASIYNQMIDRMQKNIDSQKQFVEDVSHELRTPVAIVEGHLKLLDRWGKDDAEVLEESIEASVQEITRMKSLVQEMLDLSRAVQVDVQYRHERTDVKQSVSQIHENFKLVHTEFVFNLDIDVEDEAVVNMYRNHLEQVLIILLDNAVKYSQDRKEVHLSLATIGDRVQIAVQDFGEGISEEDSQKIFDRFYRVDKARSREKGGNGLGLSIAKQLIEGYGGKITVYSAPGQGSVFRIELPLLEPDKSHEAIDNPKDDSSGHDATP